MHKGLKRFCCLTSVLLIVTLVVVVLWVMQQRRTSHLPRVRAIWVTRFDYAVPSDVSHIISNVVAAGFTDVFFQVRGNGTVFYNSHVEPWAFELSGTDVSQLGTDPGWDPLQCAIDEAAGTGLRVHAYINVLPGWKGLEAPPASAGQLWTAHPEWFMVDSLGCKMLPTSGWYAFVNPVRPDVRKHLRNIARELCQYDIAGIHLDYIRYPYDYRIVAPQRYPDTPQEEIMRHSQFSYDPVSLGELSEMYGEDVTQKEIARFRRDSITRVVQEISCVMRDERPTNCLLTASVMGSPSDGKRYAYQDSGRWIRQGFVDWAVQMNYGTKSFIRYLKDIKRAGGRGGFRSSVVVGINCKNDVDDLLAQVDAVDQSGCRGIALFSYSFLFDQQHQVTKKGRILIARIQPVASPED